MFAMSRKMVNLLGRFKIARANLIVSRSAGGPAALVTGWLAVGAPHTAHCDSPAPTIAPQLRHIVGRPGLVWFDWRSDKALKTNKRDARRAKHHATEQHCRG